MRRLVMAAGLAALLLASVDAADQQARVLMQAAEAKATIEGDLKAAIALYQQALTEAGTNRTLAAQALIGLAECHQRLGDQDARGIYQRILRDYGDQREAVTVARARLALEPTPARPSGVSVRKLWSGESNGPGGVEYAGMVSRDGRYLTYFDDFFTSLMLRDLTAGTERSLANRELLKEAGGTARSAISWDGKWVAHDWCKGGAAVLQACELRVVGIPLTVSAVPQSRSVLVLESGSGISPMDWSPDGRSIAVSIRRGDRSSQIALVGAQDGSLRVLKSVEWRRPTNVFFSPDGRDLAFDLPTSDDSNQRDIFVLAVDGSRESPVVVHESNDILIGRTPDGGHLLFASDRSGQVDLWAQEFVNRRPSGAPRLLHSSVGTERALGVTSSGAVHFSTWADVDDIEIVSLDLASGTTISPPTAPIQRFFGSNGQPVWSPDGRFLAYVSERPEGIVIGIRANDTGEVRELRPRPGLEWIQGFSWSPDGASFVASATDVRGRDGVFSIDARTGEARNLVPLPRLNLPYNGYFWSADRRDMYYALRGEANVIRARDVVTGLERTLTGVGGASMSVSPDGRWVARSRRDAATDLLTFGVGSIDGGEVRELLRLEKDQWVNNTSMPWTPDSRAVLVRKMLTVDGSRSELWLVPIDGTAPRRIDFDANRMTPYAQGRMKLHPDGRQLAFVSGPGSTEQVWVLENALNATGAGR